MDFKNINAEKIIMKYHVWYDTNKDKYIETKDDNEELPEWMEKITVIMDKDTNLEYGGARRNYCRLRGKPVTPELAFDVIRRTEEEVNAIMKVENDIYRAIHTCVWVHDGEGYVLSRNEGIEKFREYLSLYHNEDDKTRHGQSLLNMGTTKEEYFKDILEFYDIPKETLKLFRYELRY